MSTMGIRMMKLSQWNSQMRIYTIQFQPENLHNDMRMMVTMQRSQCTGYDAMDKMQWS